MVKGEIKKAQKNFKISKKPTYLFIICPPHGGSTLMHEFISTSPHVSVNNDKRKMASNDGSSNQ